MEDDHPRLLDFQKIIKERVKTSTDTGVYSRKGKSGQKKTSPITGNPDPSVHGKPWISTLGYPRYRNYPWIIRYG